MPAEPHDEPAAIRETELDVVTLLDAETAIAAVRSGTIDATFRAGLRRIAVHDPTPVYPHSLIWRSDNPHPALKTLRTYLGTVPPRRRDAGIWTPKWAHR